MAKKKVTKKKTGTRRQAQQSFEGDGFPEQPPKPVRDARDEYLTAMRDAAKASEYRKDRELRLTELMEQHDIPRIKLDGENKFFELERKTSVKLKTMPKEQERQQAEE